MLTSSDQNKVAYRRLSFTCNAMNVTVQQETTTTTAVPSTKATKLVSSATTGETRNPILVFNIQKISFPVQLPKLRFSYRTHKSNVTCTKISYMYIVK